MGMLVPDFGALGSVWGWLIAAVFQFLLTGSMNWYRLRVARRLAILSTGLTRPPT